MNLLKIEIKTKQVFSFSSTGYLHLHLYNCFSFFISVRGVWF